MHLGGIGYEEGRGMGSIVSAESSVMRFVTTVMNLRVP
jgi:hypothetical protein